MPPTKSKALPKLFTRIRQWFCRHRFHLDDMKDTNIPPPDKPHENAGLVAWHSYYANLPVHPSHTERISWCCQKCGKEFRAHCGLDVLSQHGEITHAR